jgi:hypothetical protein
MKELMRLTRVELTDLGSTTPWWTSRKDSTEHVNALINLRNIRTVLARRSHAVTLGHTAYAKHARFNAVPLVARYHRKSRALTLI